MNDIIGLTLEPVTPPPEKRVWGGWATAGFGAIVLIVLFLVMVIVMIIVAVVIAISQQNAAFTLDNITNFIKSYIGLLVSISGIIAYAVGMGLILAFIKARGRAGIAEYLGLKRINWKVLLVMILIVAAFVAVAALMSGVFQVKEDDSEMMVDIYNSTVWPALLWILVVVLAPIFEESLFRGFLFEGFRNSRLGLISTIILTSFIWTCLHAGYGLFSLATIFVLGIVMGIIRYKTGSLWSTMLMHALYNGAGMTLIALNIGN